MARRHIAPLAVVVLTAAAVATGACSKRGDSHASKAQGSRDSSQAKPAAALPVVDRSDGEGFEAPIAAKPTGPASFADAEAAYNSKKYGDAVALFTSYTEQKPGNAWGQFMLGLSAWKSGDLATADKAFHAALDIDPNHVKSLVNLSRVQLEQKHFDDAIETLTRAGELAPESADVQRLLGRTYRAQGKTDDAVAAYRQAIALDGKDAWSMNNLGLLLLEQQQPDDALPLLAKAVELHGDVAAFHNNLGMALEHTGRFVAAASEYKNALAADPAYAKAETNLTRVQAVKSGPEEPFDLGVTANGAADGKTADEPPANQ